MVTIDATNHWQVVHASSNNKSRVLMFDYLPTSACRAPQDVWILVVLPNDPMQMVKRHSSHFIPGRFPTHARQQLPPPRILDHLLDHSWFQRTGQRVSGASSCRPSRSRNIWLACFGASGYLEPIRYYPVDGRLANGLRLHLLASALTAAVSASTSTTAGS